MRKSGGNMATKTIGAEFKAFYEDKAFWPEGVWHEDEKITIDGVFQSEYLDFGSIPNNSQITLASGHVTNDNGDDFGSFEDYFRKWQKQQKTTFLTVEVPHEKAESVKAAIIVAGGKVKK